MMRQLWLVSASSCLLLPALSLAAVQKDAAFRALPPVEQVATPPIQVEGGISDNDYPPEAIRANQVGTTTAKFIVSTNGRVPVCEVENSSGWEVLDQKTCELIKERFQYVPAKNRKGRPLAYMLTQRITWRMPAGDHPLAELKPANVEIEFVVSPDGRVKSCKVLKFESPFNAKPDNACPQVTQNPQFKPFEGLKDKRVRYRNTIEISDVE